MSNDVNFNGEEGLAVDMVCSWQGVPAVCRWTDGTNAIIENLANGLTATVPVSEINAAMTAEDVTAKELQDLLGAYTGDPAGLAGWLIARGVKLGDK